MTTKTQSTIATLLSFLSIGGTALTAWLTGKATVKATHKVDKLESQADKELTFKEKVKVCWKEYIPAFATGVATAASCVTSAVMSKKVEASLTATAIMLDQGWRRYKGQVKEFLGIEDHNKLTDKLSDKDYPEDELPTTDGRTLYWEEHVGYFRADSTKLALAYADLNQRIHVEDNGKTKHFARLYDLIKDSGAELLNKNLDIRQTNYGWDYDYLDKQYGNLWIHMNMDELHHNDGSPYVKITFVEEPIFDPGISGECFLYSEDPDVNSFVQSGSEAANKEEVPWHE